MHCTYQGIHMLLMSLHSGCTDSGKKPIKKITNKPLVLDYWNTLFNIGYCFLFVQKILVREFLFVFFFLVVIFVYFVLLVDSVCFFSLIFMGDVSSGIFFLCYIFITFWSFYLIKFISDSPSNWNYTSVYCQWNRWIHFLRSAGVVKKRRN